MKRRKVLALLTTAVMTLTSLAPQGVLPVHAEGDEAVTEEAGQPEDLPFGLKGMPEDYVLDARNEERKESLQEHDAVTALQGMTEGVDYVEDTVICLADDEEEAQIIAEAYNAELVFYDQGVAELRLPEYLDVADALYVAQSDAFDMPVVEPNYIHPAMEPAEDVDLSATDPAELSIDAKTPALSWRDWVMGNTTTPARMAKPDTYIQDPASENYQWLHEAVGTYNAWATTMGSESITVAVIDNGVNPDHPELKGKVTQVKVGNVNPSAYRNSHGTHVAGIIAASANNGIGVAGIAPNVKILSLNVFGNSDTYTTENLVLAVKECIKRKVQIINMSLGGVSFSTAEETVLKEATEAGICAFASMGNDNGEVKTYPAAYRSVIAVASVNRIGERSYFSNFGSWTDIAAPGSHIISCYNPKASDKGDSVDGAGNYGFFSGTSQACPIVSGAAALYMSVYGQVNSTQILNALQSAATKTSSAKIGKIVNIGNMFASGLKAPATQSEDRKSFTLDVEGAEDGAYALYTTDGMDPALLDGAVLYGNLYTGSVDLIPAEGESSVTVKTLVVSANGEVGEVQSFVFDVPQGTVPEDMSVGKSSESLIVSDVYGRVINNKVDIYTVNLPGTAYDDSTLILNAPFPATWSVSSAKVLQLSSKEGMTVSAKALKSGSVKITCKTADGRKAVIKVKVRVPVSALSIDAEGIGFGGSLAIGKSRKLKPVVGNAYGKPSVKKLRWDYSIANNEAATNIFKACKAVKISSSGKVSINKKNWTSAMNRVGISSLAMTESISLYVSAYTTDGTGLSDSVMFLVHNCATEFTACRLDTGEVGLKDFRYSSSKWYNNEDVGGFVGARIYIAVDTMIDYDLDIEVSSSNPHLIGVVPAGVYRNSDGEVITYPLETKRGGVVVSSKDVCFIQLYVLAANTVDNKTGDSTITVKLKDGSNKKVTFKVSIV